LDEKWFSIITTLSKKAFYFYKSFWFQLHFYD
jgi:hypothetical protein